MRQVADVYRLAPLQEAMLLRAVSEPGSGAYVEQLLIWLDCEPDEAALASAWQTLVASHTVLRSSFHHARLSHPQQVVAPSVVLPWQVFRLPHASEQDIAERAAHERACGFDLQQPPLFRLVLVLTGAGACLIWTFHHLILDGWSLGRVLEELSLRYAAACGGEAASVPPARPFGDYIRWLAAQEGSDALDWWQARLAGAPVPAPLPGPTAGPGTERRRLLGAEATARLASACRSLGITLATLVRLAWAACLAEPDGACDVWFGSMVSGRPPDLAGAGEMLGMFVNTVASRVRFRADETVAALLARAQIEAFEEQRHCWLPLGKCLESAGLPAPASVVVVENYPIDHGLLSRSPLQVRHIDVHERTDVPLVVAVVPGASVELRLASPPGGLTDEALDRLAQRLATWMTDLAAAPDACFATMLGARERAEQDAIRAGLSRPLPAAAMSLAETILVAGLRIGDERAQWDAAQVRQRILRAARAAHAAPAGPIGLVGETSPDMVARMLGCIRAGRPYVPLEQTDPRCGERLRHAGATRFDPDLEGPEPPWPPPERDSYYVYTSGSTGQPKAVRQTASGVLAHARRFAASIGLGGEDCLCSTAAFAYDAAAMDIFACAITGAQLVLASPTRLGIDRLRRELVADATILHATPSLFRLLALEPLGSRLRAVVLGGEAARPADLDLFAQAAPPGCVLVNGFGPSESSTATQWFARRGTRAGAVPIGDPVADTTIVLLDGDGRPCTAPWSTGEIAIESDAVAQGYLGDIADNARFSGDDRRRRYRTGDLGRLRPSLCLDYLGRVDDQVQLGGVRVEPAEVARALASLPGVTAAEVFGAGDGDALRLEAWVTPASLDAGALREMLRARLPRPLIPSRLHAVGEFALLPNGKIDRAALRALPPLPPSPPAADTDLVRTIAACMAEVLNRPVAADDNFFDVGGHSLDALRTAGRLERKLGRSVPLQRLFDHPTPAGFAASLDETPVRVQPAAARIGPVARSWTGGTRGSPRPVETALSLFFFAAQAEAAGPGYALLRAAAERADALGLHAVWIPERHFDGFGGGYPNPSVLAAHLAACTRTVRLRAGSVVLPLHNPFRVAEEWAVVDQLSNGRVDLSIASGWHRQDFAALAPGAYERRKAAMFESLDRLQRLWAGEAVEVPDPERGHVALRSFPRPVQPRLNIWLTSQSPESFKAARAHGLNVLTNLNYKQMGDLRSLVALYRAEPGQPAGKVTVMAHTLVGRDDGDTRRHAGAAYARYVRANLGLQQQHASGADAALGARAEDAEALASRASARMIDGGSVVGDRDRCRARLAELRRAGADEVACLIDFGVDPDRALEGVELLADLCAAQPVVPVTPASCLLPAAPLQTQIWVLDALSAGRGTWMIPTLVRLTGPLDPALLHARLRTLARRHEAMRTALTDDGGIVQQRVFRDIEPSLECVLCQSEEDAIARAQAVLHEGMDLRRAPLLRAVLLRVAADHHVLLLACHHAMADGSSTAILAQELLAGPPDSPCLQPGDWASWLASRLDAGELASQEAWWAHRLQNLPPRLELRRSASPGLRRVHHLAIPDDLAEACRQRCRAARCTAFELLLAAFALALSRFFGASDLLIGLHHANRAHPDLETVVGPLVNVLPFRVRLDCGAILDRIRDDAREALRNHEVPYARLASRHGRPGDMAEDPLLDAVMLHQNLPQPPQAGPLEWSRIDLDGGETRFPLTFVVREAAHRLTAKLEVDEARLPAPAAHELLESLHSALRELAAAAPPVLARAEPMPAVRLPGPHLLTPFMTYSQLHPDEPAVAGPDGALSRGELLGRARRLAGALRARVAPGARVAVLVPPSTTMLVAIYGVLLADCCVVPLDARSPPARLAVELQLAQVACVVTDEVLDHATLPPLQDGPEWAAAPTGANPAYITFTSGSTGAPKGVAVGHDSVRALIGWARQTFSKQDLAATLLTASIRFDMSVFGLYVPLAGPGRIVIAPDIASLLDTPPAAPVSLIYTVPSALRAVLAAGWRIPASTRVVNLGGEALDADLLAQVLRQAPCVCNMYGPTESTSNAFFEAYARATAPTIGRPIAGTGAWVRTADGRCAAVGEIGELVLTGAGLALGYVNVPEHPAFTSAGYRTGDNARMLADGRFVFLGRADAQVKVRGHRLELSEVEHQLVALDGIKAAGCRVRDDGLEAFVVHAQAPPRPAPAAAPLVQRWAACLEERLPAHAVPTRWISVPRLALTATGKLDRAALAALTWQPQPASHAAAERQALIAREWEAVLGVADPDPATSFFQLGGHSLLAIKLRSRLQEHLGIDVPLRLLFEHPTIAGLDAALPREPGPSSSPAPLRSDEAAAFEPFSLTDLQQAYWVGARDDLTLGGVGTQSYLELDTTIELAAFEAALATLVERHAALRTVIDPDGRQRVLPAPGAFVLPVEDLRNRHDRETRLAELRRTRSHHRCDPAAWPLLRIWATLLPDRTRMQISLPAILLDAHSAYLLARELDCLLQGRALPEPGPSFRDVICASAFASHQGRTDLPGGPALPLKRAPATVADVRFRRLQLRLPAELWQGVRAAGASRALTPAGLVLSAFAWTLAGWAEQLPFSLVVTHFNRPPIHPLIERVVGDFTSARLLAVEGAPDFAAFSRQVQAGLWQALDDPGLESVRCIRAMRQAGREAAFGVVFTSTLGLDSVSRTRLGDVAYALTQTSQVWLDHKVREDAGALVCTWDFVDDLFCDGMPEAMLLVFERVLRLLLRDGWSSTAAGLPPAQLTARCEYNATQWAPSLPLLHEIALREAADAEAVVCDGRRVTGRALAGAATAIRNRLVDAGIQPGALIAVPSCHGWEQAAAILGVMAAGGAWVPLDPAWPAHRLRQVLDVSGASLAVTWPGAELPAEGVAVAADDLDRAPGASDFAGDGEATAYVIFTSGSTGAPKGVAIPHAGAVNTVLDLVERFGLRGERVLGLSHLHFDLAVFDLFGAWLSGGTVIHPAAHERRDPQAWTRLIREERVTCWNSVPALTLMLVEHLEARREALPGLRHAFLSGDWIPVGLPDRLRAVAPNCRVVSLGGATEASIWSIVHPIGAIDPAWTSIPYGRPLRGQGIHVLDAARRPRPDWAAGELHISGRGVALGYHGDPERTAASFWRHPETGERMYATGDLGRFHPGGWIEFLGRRDGQAKVRGHRVELGEIETLLCTHPQVRQAVVSAAKTPSGQVQLVAHVVGDAPESAIRRHLEDRLPAAHVPQRIVVSTALAVSENGKIDRAALAHVPEAAPPLPCPDAPPALLALVRDLLQRPDASEDDDFFALGGDSVLAVRLLARVEQAFGCRVPIRHVFAHPTVRGLSAFLVPAAAPAQTSLDPSERRRARTRRGRRTTDGPAWTIEAVRPGEADAIRKSHRSFSPLPLPKADVEALVVWLCAVDGRRLHPSSGGAYGVQTYLMLVPGRTEERGGSWWLDADAASLMQVGARGWMPAFGDWPPNASLAHGAAFALVFVADLATLAPLYGEESMRLATLEAGYMGQLLAARAPLLDLSLCAVGSVDEAALGEELALGPQRRVVHVALGGRPLQSLIEADARWPEGPVATRPSRQPARVLLTGASGRLGRGLLQALLARGHEVVCLLRGDAEARLAQLLAESGLGHLAERVQALGCALPEEIDQQSAGPIDAVVHAAADVSFVKPYPDLRTTNVLGTRAILAFCAQTGAVLHHVSSLSVFREAGVSYLPETQPLPAHPPTRGGYAQSKWAAEHLVRGFMAADGAAHIHRLALVVSGASDAADYVAALQRGCKALGAWPAVDVDLPLVRLEIAAQAIAAAIGETPRTWHFQEPVRLTMRQLADRIGGLESVSPDEWLRQVEAVVALTPDHPLAPYLDVLRGSRFGGALDPDGPSGGRLDGTSSWHALRHRGVAPAGESAVLLDALT